MQALSDRPQTPSAEGFLREMKTFFERDLYGGFLFAPKPLRTKIVQREMKT